MSKWPSLCSTRDKPGLNIPGISSRFSNLARLCNSNGLPPKAKAGSSSVDPQLAEPKIESVTPNLLEFLANSEKPECAKVKVDNKNPSCTWLLRNDNVPKCEKSDAKSTESARGEPKHKDLKPRQDEVCTNREKSKVAKSTISDEISKQPSLHANKQKPVLARDRKDKNKPCV